jgi:hypothetical protein
VTPETALRASEVLLALALLQQAAEHLALEHGSRGVHGLRAGLATALLAGVVPAAVLAALLATSLALLARYRGPFQGGADRLAVLLQCGLLAARLAGDGPVREIALGYVAVQTVFSYALAGVAKLGDPGWRGGHALAELLARSSYPVSEDLRALARHRRALAVAGWGVVGFECLFPLALLAPGALAAALAAALLFHVANALLLGLQRFLWVWLAAYPLVWWLGTRVWSLAPGAAVAGG